MALGGVEFYGGAPGSLGEARAQRGIIQESRDLRGEGSSVADGKKQPVGAVAKRRGERANVGGNDRRAAGEAFQERVGEIFEPKCGDHRTESALVEPWQSGGVDLAFELDLVA